MNPLQIPDLHYRAMVYIVNNHDPDDEITIADLRNKSGLDGLTGMTLNAMARNGLLRKIRHARKTSVYHPAVYRIEHVAYNRALRYAQRQ